MAIDSKVAFQNRAAELGIEEADIEALADKGINSYATYAYCCTFQPGQTDDTALTIFFDNSSWSSPRRCFF
jgi:hypothetical protein